MELVVPLPQTHPARWSWERPVKALLTWYRVQRMTNALETLSDRALKDIGVYRCAIPNLAYERYRLGLL